MQKVRFIILGSLFVQCWLYSVAGLDCPFCADPNDYVDNPSTLDNGLFECGDPNLTSYSFTPPIFWSRQPNPIRQQECYAAILTDFDPPLADWNIPAPYEGDSFVLLSTGGFDEISSGDIRGSKIYQKVDLSEGDVIIGAYFFGTYDYPQFNDYGRIFAKLDPNYILTVPDPNDWPVEEFTIAHKMVGSEPGDIGSSESTEGWISFEYIVDANEAGPYLLCCEVVDDQDTIYDSFFAIDGLHICKGLSPADLNRDCQVTLLDYSIISSAWMSFCPDVFDPNTMDPNDIADPNIPCQLADIDNSWYVDANDIMLFSDQWLAGSNDD